MTAAAMWLGASAAVAQDSPAARENRTFNVGGIEFTMVAVDGGTFMMGATPDQHTDDPVCSPAHSVTLSDYYIGQTEVLQKLWTKVMGTNPSVVFCPGGPVTNVSWDDVQEFIEKLNALTGEKFRLPTEAEWEFAARGGVKQKPTLYAGSDNIDEVGLCDDNVLRGRYGSARYKPNELGIYDMSGNVSEWVQDWFRAGYPSEPQTDPQGPAEGLSRVYRGGCYLQLARYSRISLRMSEDQNIPSAGIGFRLAL